MSREIRFRALRDDMATGWVYGSLCYDAFGNPRIQEKHGGLFVTCLKGTEGQYTGITDKNGIEVFDGSVTYEGECEVFWCDTCHGWAIKNREVNNCHQCDGDFTWLDFVDDIKAGRTSIDEHPTPTN